MSFRESFRIAGKRIRDNRYTLLIVLILFCELVAWLPDLMGDFKGLSSWMDIAWHVAYHARAALLMLLAAMVASRLLHKLDHYED